MLGLQVYWPCEMTTLFVDASAGLIMNLKLGFTSRTPLLLWLVYVVQKLPAPFFIKFGWHFANITVCLLPGPSSTEKESCASFKDFSGEMLAVPLDMDSFLEIRGFFTAVNDGCCSSGSLTSILRML